MKEIDIIKNDLEQLRSLINKRWKYYKLIILKRFSIFILV
jgi:hypothetical protein